MTTTTKAVRRLREHWHTLEEAIWREYGEESPPPVEITRALTGIRDAIRLLEVSPVETHRDGEGVEVCCG